jgi:phosphoribulokinase
MLQPLMLGIVGANGAGKTTLARGIARLLGKQGVTPICLDDYHRHERAERARLKLTSDDPAAYDLGLMAAHLASLRGGGTIRKPVYDHRTGKLREAELVTATGLVLAYGALTLTPPSLAELFDLTVYLDPEPELLRRWRQERDISQRGYSYEEVASLEAARDRDISRFVRVQRAFADLVVRFTEKGTVNVPAATVLLRPRIGERLTMLAVLQDALPSLKVTGNEIDDDGLTCTRIVVPYDFSLSELYAMQRTIWPELRPNEGPPPLDTVGNMPLYAVQLLIAVAMRHVTR